MIINNITTKFNYGLSISPVSIFIKFAYENEEGHDYSIDALFSELKIIQDKTGCYDIIVEGDFSYSNIYEEFYWVFARMLESMRCNLTIYFDSIEQARALNTRELPSAMYSYYLCQVSNSILKDYIEVWEKSKISESDAIILDLTNSGSIISAEQIIRKHNIKSPIYFNPLNVDPDELLAKGCINVSPLFLEQIWK